MANATVVLGTPLTVPLLKMAEGLVISAEANVGTIDITFTLDGSDPVNVAWTPGQLAAGTKGFEFFDFPITSFTVTSTGAGGAGKVNWAQMF